MTDPDRVALSAFLPAFLFRFIHPIHANFNAHHLPPECPPAICHTSYYPIRASSSVSHRSKFVLLVKHLGHARPSITFHAFSLYLRSTSQPVFFQLFLHPSSQQPHKKKLAISHIPPSSPHSLQASMRTRTCVRLSMYLLPVAVFISHQKKDLLGKRGTGAQKNRRNLRSEQYFIVVPIQETIIKSIKIVFFFSWNNSLIIF